jgi:hypothetical protein
MSILPKGFRPFLSCAISIEEVLAWPKEKKELYTYSVKYDGVRVLVTKDEVYTRNMKPIANRALAGMILKEWDVLDIDDFTILDCELTHKAGFASANKAIQTFDLLSNIEELKINIFDSFGPVNFRVKYTDREIHHIYVNGSHVPGIFGYAKNYLLDSLTLDWYKIILNNGFEGIMIRKKKSNYKFGRATLQEETYFKVKPSFDSEAIIAGIHEGEVNLNTKKKNEIGLTKRSSHMAGKRGNGTLGAITCIDINPESPFYHRQFSIGTFEGLKDADLKNIYINASEYMEKKINYSYAAVASKGLPRHPIFKRFI